MDAAAGRQGDRAAYGSEVSPGARVAHLAGTSLVAPASCAASEGAKRRSGPAVDLDPLVSCKKKARKLRSWIIFQDESGVSQRPSVRRMWAPRGETPVLIHAFNWKKMSVAAALAYRWDGKRSRLFFQMKPDSYNEDSLIAFLRDLKREFRGKKCILIWDGLPGHKSKKMKAYLASQKRLIVEVLPGYSPDLNPVESLWGNLKTEELANRCVDDLAEVAEGVSTGMARIGACKQYAQSFLDHAGLFF